MKWAVIEERPNYSISTNGDVRNDKTGRIMKLHINKLGYATVMLGRKTSPLLVHRLVAKAFIPNPENKPQVDHINGNRSDNRVENLRWATASENHLAYGFEQCNRNRWKKIIATKGDEQIIFDSRTECTEYFKCSPSKLKYNREYKKGLKKGWTFRLVEDIV